MKSFFTKVSTKRAISVFMCLLMVMSIVPTFSFMSVAKGSILGDITDDGIVDAADAILILRYDAGLTALTDDKLALADVTGDKKVDSADAIKIARYDAGLISSLGDFQVDGKDDASKDAVIEWN